MRGIPRIFGAAVVGGAAALAMAACTHPADTSAGGGSPETAYTASPSVEGTGPETPQSPGAGGGGGGRHSPPLPGLPTGGDNHSNQKCVQFSWLGDPIPHGDIVKVAGPMFDPDTSFSESSSADCPGVPPCAGFEFTAADSGAQCAVAIGYEGGTIDSDGTESAAGSVSLFGELRCPGVGSAACQDDAAAIRAKRSSPVDFAVQYDPAGSTSSATPTDTFTPTDTGSP